MGNQDLIEAARCGLAWYEDFLARKKRTYAFHELFKKVCLKVIESEGTVSRFTLKELAEDANSIESSSAQGKAFSKFSENLTKVRSSVIDVAVDRGFSVIPAVDMDRSETVNVLSFMSTETPQEEAVSIHKVPKGAIRYTFDEKQSLWRFFGFMAGLKLSIWPFFSFAIIALALGTLVFWWTSVLMSHLIAQPSAGSFLLVFATLFLVTILWRRYRAFDRFLMTKIALTHDALARFSAPQSVAVLRNQENDYPIIDVISASGVCSVCEGEIRLRKPHFDCSHEVIGACRNNPTEHCFTFDYVTRLGWPITETARRST